MRCAVLLRTRLSALLLLLWQDCLFAREAFLCSDVHGSSQFTCIREMRNVLCAWMRVCSSRQHAFPRHDGVSPVCRKHMKPGTKVLLRQLQAPRVGACNASSNAVQSARMYGAWQRHNDLYLRASGLSCMMACSVLEHMRTWLAAGASAAAPSAHRCWAAAWPHRASVPVALHLRLTACRGEHGAGAG